MTQMKKTQIRKKRKNHKNTIQIRFFYKITKRTKMEIFALCVMAFEPIKIHLDLFSTSK